MKFSPFSFTCLFLFSFLFSSGQNGEKTDSTIENLQQIPLKYISTIDKKVDKYSKQITSKTEKTLTKLSKWENKVKGMVEKVNPGAAERLFGKGQQTFTSVLQRIKEGKHAFDNSQQQYNEYRDKLTTDLKYLSVQKEQLNQKFIKPLNEVKKKVDSLSSKVDETEALEQFIKERKKQLINTSIQYIGKSKYLTKINKEAWYYAETMKNYKQIFSDPEKTEQTAKTILNTIPAFQQFMRKNSMLASLFGQPGDMASTANFTGLQTRAGVQSLIQTRIEAGGPGAQQIVSQNMQAAQAKLNELKDKLLKNPFTGNGGGELPDFKPNMQKTKTFKQRLEWGTDLQFVKNNNLMPTTSDIALSVGYKLNDKSVVGIGASYKMGLGTITKLHISTQGLGLRSFIDWKLKHQFFLSGGYEMNYLPTIKNQHVELLYGKQEVWQKAALFGISKKINVKTKWFKSTKLQLLYDFLARQHVPISQQILFRIGYNF